MWADLALAVQPLGEEQLQRGRRGRSSGGGRVALEALGAQLHQLRCRRGCRYVLSRSTCRGRSAAPATPFHLAAVAVAVEEYVPTREGVAQVVVLGRRRAERGSSPTWSSSLTRSVGQTRSHPCAGRSANTASTFYC